MSYNYYKPQQFSILPPVVKNLIILNVIAFIASFTFAKVYNIDLNDILGLHFPLGNKFKVYQIVTYLFMHGDLSHIFFNLLAIWMFGYQLENAWGSKKFLIYYLLTGIGAAAIHYAVVYFQMLPTLNALNELSANANAGAIEQFLNGPHFKINSIEMKEVYQNFIQSFSDYNEFKNPELGSTATQEKINIFIANYKNAYYNAPVIVGASGALFGILLAFGMLFPESMVFIYFFPVKAKYFVIIYGAIELYSGLKNNVGDNIAHFAHLGGMLIGFIIIKLWYSKKLW